MVTMMVNMVMNDIGDDVDDNHDDDDEPSKGEEGYESRGGGDQQVAKQKNLKIISTISSI